MLKTKFTFRNFKSILFGQKIDMLKKIHKKYIELLEIICYNIFNHNAFVKFHKI